MDSAFWLGFVCDVPFLVFFALVAIVILGERRKRDVS